MRTLLALGLAALISAPTLASGNSGNNTASPAGKYSLDTKKSVINWTGKKVTGQHSGKILFNSGTLTAEKGLLKGGDFVVDMSSMNCEDIKDAETNGKFMGHMKSADFFDTEHHPKSTLKITNAKKLSDNTYEITGDLTIKGITKPVTFPAEVTMKGNEMMAKGTVKVDRTKYDIKYGSGAFFEGLGDKMIYDDFEMAFDVVANAAK